MCFNLNFIGIFFRGVNNPAYTGPRYPALHGFYFLRLTSLPKRSTYNMYAIEDKRIKEMTC